ncbi:MAG TPA: hypothetical protein VMW62_11135 [Chloroflexota bacterium]|nr:hypothetical protein [Chloroflexota bacterium]
MIESFNSVLDRIGAFNAATEKLAKHRAREITMVVNNVRLRLATTAENYGIEVTGAPAEAATALRTMGYAAQGNAFAREVRKSERSWNVASQLEDILQEVLGLGPDVAMTVETVDSSLHA